MIDSEEEFQRRNAAFSPNPRGDLVAPSAGPGRSMPTVRASDAGKQDHTGWVTQMNDDDLKNDAIDAQIQSAIGRSRGNTLQGMAQAPGVPALGMDNDADDAITQQMIAEDEAEAAKKAQGGGGGLGGMASSVMGMFGGG